MSMCALGIVLLASNVKAVQAVPHPAAGHQVRITGVFAKNHLPKALASNWPGKQNGIALEVQVANQKDAWRSVSSFLGKADKRFVLKSNGASPVAFKLQNSTYSSDSSGKYRVYLFGKFDGINPVRGRTYSLVAQNGIAGYLWIVDPAAKLQL